MRRGDNILVLIGVFKLVKVLSLVAFAIVVLYHLHTPLDRILRGAAYALGVDPERHRLPPLLARLHGLSADKRVAIGVAALCYAALFLVEGCGLLARAVWAEYLTTLITMSFLPLEVYELVEHESVVKLAVLIVNVAIVVYLVVRLHHDRRWPFAHRARVRAPARPAT